MDRYSREIVGVFIGSRDKSGDLGLWDNVASRIPRTCRKLYSSNFGFSGDRAKVGLISLYTALRCNLCFYHSPLCGDTILTQER